MIKEIQLARYSDNHESTLGLLLMDWRFFSHALEDEFRETKVPGETRIPNGLYDLELRKFLSPKTEAYRDRFDWFVWHIQIMGVPTHEYCYLHYGNDDDDTDGCPLMADQANNNTIETGFIGSSIPAYKRFYLQIYPLLADGYNIKLRVFDIQKLVRLGLTSGGGLTLPEARYKV